MQIYTANNNRADRQFVITRLIKAPGELVYKVWTEAEHLAQWWGPNGFTNTILDMEVKPGGIWRYIMHAPDGTNYPNRILYSEVVEPERLEYVHGADVDRDPDRLYVTVTFDEENGKTNLTMQSVFKSAEALEKVKPYAVEEANQTLNRLEQHLAKIQAMAGLVKLNHEN
jgi:uncharacterized protein YndB with AHSA1/START domain